MKYAFCCLALLLAACASTGPAGPERRAAPMPADKAAPAQFDARLSLYAYPYAVKTFAFESQRQVLEMAYMDVAPAGEANGKTVLLMHGKNFSGASWARTIDALSKRGYRVVVPDQIGFGKSAKPTRYQFTFQALARNTAALLDAIGVHKAAVVGHSMGGMLATRFVLMYPDRTDKLVLVNPIGLEDWKRKVPYVDVQAWYRNELRQTPDGVREYMKANYFDGKWKPEYDKLADIQMGWSESADREQLAWVSALTYDMVFTQPVLYEFGQVAAPTLLIVGLRDRTALGKNLVAPEVARTMGLYESLGRAAAKAFPDSRLVELEGIGHIPQFEAWDGYIEALAGFLD